MTAGLWRGLVVAVALVMNQPATADMKLKVLTLNLWGGGLHAGRSIDDSVAALRMIDADVIALQETWWPEETPASDKQQGLACVIAERLGLYCHEQAGPAVQGQNAVLSRHPLVGSTPSGLGVRLEIAGEPLTLFNLHLHDAPYQPYQLKRIPYDDSPWLDTAEEAVDAAKATRGAVIDILERELAAQGTGAVIVAGDFNEPSHRDWTPRAAALGLQPVAVPWPTTLRLEAMGLVDAWRDVHPDEIEMPGHTWTALPSPENHQDRIDFIFARGSGLTVQQVSIVGEPDLRSGIAIPNWPSDHRGVLAGLHFKQRLLVESRVEKRDQR